MKLSTVDIEIYCPKCDGQSYNPDGGEYWRCHICRHVFKERESCKKSVKLFVCRLNGNFGGTYYVAAQRFQDVRKKIERYVEFTTGVPYRIGRDEPISISEVAEEMTPVENMRQSYFIPEMKI